MEKKTKKYIVSWDEHYHQEVETEETDEKVILQIAVEQVASDKTGLVYCLMHNEMVEEKEERHE